MARIARVVAPDLPHHVTQRGNWREPVFFEADDYRLYRRLVAAAARRRRCRSLGLLSDAQSRPPVNHARLA
jgi:putative transposase